MMDSALVQGRLNESTGATITDFYLEQKLAGEMGVCCAEPQAFDSFNFVSVSSSDSIFLEFYTIS